MNKKSFTMADRRSSRFHISNIQRKAVAFTMAEILLSLTIIGVVAAITLPSLTGNINEKTWNTQRKALYARMSQAIPLMGSLNGYGIGATESETASNAAKAFVTNGLAKVYKINNICDYNHLKDCGIPSKLTNINGCKIDFPKRMTSLNSSFSSYTKNTYVVAFETANGENIALFYNPLCKNINKEIIDSSPNEYYYFFQSVCVNLVFDLNGTKGPNTVGKDIGAITAISPIDSIVAEPDLKAGYLSSGDQETFYSTSNMMHKCKDYNGRLPNFNEMISMSTNNTLVVPKKYSTASDGLTYWVIDSGQYYYGSALRGRIALCGPKEICRSYGAKATIVCVAR